MPSTPIDEVEMAANANPAPLDVRGNNACPRLAEAERIAREVYDLHGRCSTSFGPGLCNDPGFNILLDLFLSAIEGKRRSVTAVCIGSRAAMATALRYVVLLHKAGYVDRVADASDRRRSYVMLSAEGWSMMLDLLRPPGARTADGGK